MLSCLYYYYIQGWNIFTFFTRDTQFWNVKNICFENVLGFYSVAVLSVSTWFLKQSNTRRLYRNTLLNQSALPYYTLYVIINFNFFTHSFKILIKFPFSISFNFQKSFRSFIAELTIYSVFIWFSLIIVTRACWFLKTPQGTFNLKINSVTGYNIFWWQCIACFIRKNMDYNEIVKSQERAGVFMSKYTIVDRRCPRKFSCRNSFCF